MLLGLSVGTWMLLSVMISFTLGGLFFWYAAKHSGQFEDVESIKYRMLEDGELDIEEPEKKEEQNKAK